MPPILDDAGRNDFLMVHGDKYVEEAAEKIHNRVERFRMYKGVDAIKHKLKKDMKRNGSK